MKFVEILENVLLFLKKYNGYIWSTVFIVFNLLYQLYTIPHFHISNTEATRTIVLAGLLTFGYYKFFQAWIPFGINKLRPR